MADEVYEMMGVASKTGRLELNRDNIGILLMIASVLLGGWFRIFPAFLAGFPVNDGGMFYTMIKDLQANQYQLPLYTSYNRLNIPYAYPPLAFYVGAGVSDVFNIPPIEVVRWLPGIVNIFCLLAFYFLAKDIVRDTLTSAASMFIYAMIPHMSEWLSMGGGLTRSFGMLFMTLTVLYAYRLFTRDHHHDLWVTILFGSLTTLSHPESTVYALGVCFYIWLVKSCALKKLIRGLLVSSGVLLLTAPWYGSLLYRHGMNMLISAIQTGRHSFWAPLIVINMDGITAEPYLDLLGVLCVFGIILLIVRKKYFIPGMLFVIYLIAPRSAHTVGNLALALGGGYFVIEVFLPALSTRGHSESAAGKTLHRGVVISFALTTPYLLINSIYQGFLISQNHVDETERTAMQWIMNNTPANSRFLVVTGNTDAMCDSVSEWFPALTERTSLTTAQGREWISAGHFEEFIYHRATLQACIGDGLGCLGKESGYFGDNFDYVYIAVQPPADNCKSSTSPAGASNALITALEDSQHYSILYKSTDAFVFGVK